MALRHPGADFLLEFAPALRADRLSPIASDAACRPRSMLSSVLAAKPASTSAAAVVSSSFSAAAKSSPRSGMPRAAQ